MIRTLSQNKWLHSLLNQTGLMSEKAQLSKQYSNGRTNSTSELSYDECQALITFLDRILKGENYPSLPVQRGNSSPSRPMSEAEKYALFDKNNTQHMYLLSMCRQIGWTRYNAKLGKQVADLNALGAWLAKYGYFKKPLKKYNAKELPTLITQFEGVVKHGVQSIEK